MSILLVLVFLYLFAYCATYAFLEWRDAIDFDDNLLACFYALGAAFSLNMAIHCGAVV